jgi:hypothetical protein
MVNYVLRLELNYKNKMIFAVQRGCKDVAIFMFEDCNRKGELMRDFSYLYPRYYESEAEWDDERNLITVKIYMLCEDDDTEELTADLLCLAESMVEFKPAVNHKVEFFNDPKVREYYLVNSDGPTMEFINYMLSLCETKEEVFFSEDDFNHLRQE